MRAARRGKLQQARAGHYSFGHAPYGYRYVPKQDGVTGHLVVDEAEADFVRLLYHWLVDEQRTIRQILKRLNFGPWYPRSGHRPWSPSVVHHILADPLYTGTAYANRYRYVPPHQPRGPRKPSTSEHSCRQPRPQEEWIPIPVPALIDQHTADRAQAQLARNAALSFRHNTKYSYLLRCLLTCQHCGLAMFGGTYAASATQPERRYYRCHGKDCILSARAQACPRRRVKAAELEAAVWEHACQLLADPARLLAQFQRAAEHAAEGDTQEQLARQRVRGRLDRLAREERRLLDAYQAELLTLDELAERRTALALRRQALEEEQEQAERLRQERMRALAVLGDLTAFCARVCSQLHTVSLEEKQAILPLLIERIIVGDDTLEIRHVIPLTPLEGAPERDAGEETLVNSGADPPLEGLCSDGVHATPLPARPL